MRVLDTLQDRPLHRLVLVENEDQVSIFEQSARRPMVAYNKSLRNDSAYSAWREMLLESFLRVTSNRHDAEMLCQRRMASIH